MASVDLQPSKLGTKDQYVCIPQVIHSDIETYTLIDLSWDEVYQREVANFKETGDEGEIW
ncbi:hypothetical protein DENSPDRAFT_832759 [Dentipellis sp. KUC8613]|nr:hypothetical protein DENSPDRAFT_832759 [Dentipellis sp. KUC8613]